MKEKNKQKIRFPHHSELRKDIVSGDWVLVSPERFHPDTLKRWKPKREIPPHSKDIFRDPFKSVDEHILWEYVKGKPTGEAFPEKSKSWRILVLQNKYPAVAHDAKRVSKKQNFFPIKKGVGHHDLLITKEYRDNFPRLSSEEAFHVFEAFRDRYLMFFTDRDVDYVSIFHNWGKQAGASVFHPHYQIIGIPVIPPEVKQSLDGARRYYVKKKKCVYCAMIDWEKKQKKRIILESEYAIAFAPFVSHNNFELRVFPKRHRAFFENTPDVELEDIAHLLQRVLRKVEKNLRDPDYNFYIHTPPIEEKKSHKYYHWHIEVIPRWNIPAGFEYATGIFINVVNPDVAAKILRGK